MQKRLTVLTEVIQQFHHILKVAFTRNRVRNIIGACQHLVFATCILQNLALLHTVHESGVHMKRDCFLVSETGQNRLI